jgi:hypothetical protein
MNPNFPDGFLEISEQSEIARELIALRIIEAAKKGVIGTLHNDCELMELNTAASSQFKTVFCHTSIELAHGPLLRPIVSGDRDMDRAAR